MPMPVLDACVNPCAEPFWIRCCVRSKAMPGLIAVVAGRHHVGSMAPTILLGQKVFCGGPKAIGLAERQTVRCGKAGMTSEPHGEATVVAPARLAMKGNVASAGGGMSHSGIQEREGVCLPSLRRTHRHLDPFGVQAQRRGFSSPASAFITPTEPLSQGWC